MIRSRKQAEALNFIKRYTSIHGYPPSRREIADELGFKSSSTAQLLINDMIEEGLIEVAPGVSRGVAITGSNMKHGEVTM